MICTPLGQYEAQARLNDTENALSTRPGAVTHSAIREIATFHLGAHWLGLPVEAVVEAIDLVGATRLANAPKQVFGAMIHQNATLPIYNLHAALGLPIPDGGMHRQQVVVVRGEDGAQFGFLVDRLGEILEVPVADIDDLSNIYVGIASVLASVVKSSQRIGLPMLVVLSVASMSAQLRAADMSEAVDSDETQSLD